jgi:hypothetical protein
MISLPWFDTEMKYDEEHDEWIVPFYPGNRQGIIMDVSFFRIWAVLKDGTVGEPYDLPVKWHYSLQI